MCDAISITADTEELTKQFRLDNILLHNSNRHQIKPTESVSVIVDRWNKRHLEEFRWGLMPFWAKESFYMDSTEMLEKRAFGLLFKKQRCIIPCSAFHYRRDEGKHARTVTFSIQNGLFGIAALFDVWRSSVTGDEMRTCTMLMTAANRHIQPYHELMPAILNSDGVDVWLRPDMKDPYVLQSLLRPREDVRLVAGNEPAAVSKASPFPKWV